jgi:hypothetical protein
VSLEQVLDSLRLDVPYLKQKKMVSFCLLRVWYRLP